MHPHTPDGGASRRAVDAANTRRASHGAIVAAAAVEVMFLGFAYAHIDHYGWPAAWAFVLGIVLAMWTRLLRTLGR